MGSGLVAYILRRRWNLNDLVEAQKSHYGALFLDKPKLEAILELIAKWDRGKSKLDLTSLMLKHKELCDVAVDLQSSGRSVDSDKIAF